MIQIIDKLRGLFTLPDLRWRCYDTEKGVIPINGDTFQERQLRELQRSNRTMSGSLGAVMQGRLARDVSLHHVMSRSKDTKKKASSGS